MSNFLQNRVRSINISSLMLIETGTYNQQFSRPYVSNINGRVLDTLSERINQHKGSRTTSNTFAGIGNEILTVQSEPESNVQLVNGWDTKRMRFALSVVVINSLGSKVTYHFQGYTDYSGVSMQGHIDPNMVFYINSFIGVTENIINTPMGRQVIESITESSHLLYNNNAGMIGASEQQFSMRPADVFNRIQTYDLNSHDLVLDTRLLIGRDAQRSVRSNNLNNNYLARVVDSYNRGNSYADLNMSNNDILGESRKYSLEDPLSDNPFLKAISDMKGYMNTSNFTWSDLIKIDPNVDNVTNIITHTTATLAQQPMQGTTEYWHGTNRETQVATILGQAIPALLLECMINRITFKSTNYTIGNQPTSTIIDGRSVTSADMTMYFNRFINRLENEVLRDITFNFQDGYALDVTADLYGNTRLSISLSGNPPVDFDVPTFSDGLIVPVITHDINKLDVLANDFTDIFNHVRENVTGMSAVNFNI